MNVGWTSYHAKYFAHDLTRRAPGGIDRLSASLFDAAVDLNPHQIEAALFALQSPLSKGVILADEVGLGKTIEAGIVLCQFWAERKRRLLVICPASLRKQWALELEEKFNLPAIVLDAKSSRDLKRDGRDPLVQPSVLVLSVHFANSIREDLKTIAWDLVVIDEAHKLRNAYRPSNKVGQGIRWATEDCRKLLLTATPLQNSLLELYGLSTLIDERIFGDVNSFRAQFAGAGSNLDVLRQRLIPFCKRTLRNQVTEYVRYTERRPITRPFRPTDDEHALYEAVSAFLQREIRKQGIVIERVDDLDGALGTSHGGMIRLLNGLTSAVAFTTLVHEYAHELLHRAADRPASRDTRELEAEAVAFVVGSAVGLDAADASRDYIHLYRGDREALSHSLVRIQRAASVMLSELEPVSV